MMMKIRLVWWVFLLVVVKGEDYVMYEGLRVDLSALTLNRDIISVVTPALSRTQHAIFPAFKDGGPFASELKIHNIHVQSYHVQEPRFEMNRFEYRYPVYKLKGGFEAIYFEVAFDYELTWIGIPINAGRGLGAVTNVNGSILVLFNESDPDVWIPHPWDVKNLTLSSFLAPTSWVLSALHKHFIPVFHKVVDDAMFDFAHNLLKTYRDFEDVLPEDIDLVFHNDILSVTPTVQGSRLTIAFKTNMTVNKFMHKKMHKKLNGSVVPQGDFDYCLAAQLVPDVLDAVSKANYLDKYIQPEVWGLASDKVKEFFEIMPGLKEQFTGEEQFAIICLSSSKELVNDLTQRGSHYELLEMQFPVRCTIYVPTKGLTILVTQIYMRFYYDLRTNDDAFFGHVSGAYLYDFKTLPDLPNNARNLFEYHLLMFTLSYDNKPLLSPGIKVFPNRHDQLLFKHAYIMHDEICFYYMEKRPLYSN